ncbi:helix-turn-helix domain-containing protein [Flavobacterium sp. LC2016-01]|nr:helix-turn-helix domain-containing protein [Flavobacterium sp. LC2016-01]
MIPNETIECKKGLTKSSSDRTSMKKHVNDDEFGSLNVKFHSDQSHDTALWFNSNCFSLTLAIKASGLYTTKTNTLEVAPKTLFFSRPDTHRELKWYSLDEIYHIKFSERFLAKYAGVELFKTFPFLVLETVIPENMASENFEDLCSICHQIDIINRGNSPFKKNIIANLVTRLLLRIKRNFWQDYDKQLAQDKEHDILKQFIKNLEHHSQLLQEGKARTQLRVKDYASMQGIHANYLSDVIKKRTGKMVSHWITEKTVLAAENLLQNNSLSIKEISYRLGFPYISYFTIFLKKHTGHTPRDLRNIKI